MFRDVNISQLVFEPNTRFIQCMIMTRFPGLPHAVGDEPEKPRKSIANICVINCRTNKKGRQHGQKGPNIDADNKCTSYLVCMPDQAGMALRISVYGHTVGSDIFNMADTGSNITKVHTLQDRVNSYFTASVHDKSDGMYANNEQLVTYNSAH